MKTGRCPCGAVRFEADAVPDTFIICHCEMCRRWQGSAVLGVVVPDEGLRWSGTERVAERQTTSWAKRAWCRDCGTGVYLKSTLDEGKDGEATEIPLGIFDDASGFRPSDEIWIDHKPDSYAFVDMGQALHTRAECIETMPYFTTYGSLEQERER